MSTITSFSIAGWKRLLEYGSIKDIKKAVLDSRYHLSDLLEVIKELQTKEVIIEGELYLRRYYVSPKDRYAEYGVRKMVHYFATGDLDKRLHNHPWNWATSVILQGGYTEQRLTGFSEGAVHTTEHVYRPGDINRLSGTDFHRITDVLPHTFTFFMNGPARRPWGFLNGPAPVTDYNGDGRPADANTLGIVAYGG